MQGSISKTGMPYMAAYCRCAGGCTAAASKLTSLIASNALVRQSQQLGVVLDPGACIAWRDDSGLVDERRGVKPL